MKKSVKKIGIAILIGILMFSIGCGKSTSTVKETANKETTTEETTIKLDKDNAININYDNDDYKNILDLFTKNELQAKNKYLNKTVKMTGEVGDIKTKDGKITVFVLTENRLYGANLIFKDTKENEEKIINLKTYDYKNVTKDTPRGDVITIYGYFEECKSAGSTSTGERINITYCEFA